MKLKGLVGLLEGQKWESAGGSEGWEQADFTHQCGTGNRARRFVAVRKLTRGSRQLVLKLPEKFLHQEEWRAWEGMSLNVAFG